MRRIRWTARARRDFIRIADDYSKVAPHFPPRLLKRIGELAALLAEKPGMVPKVTRRDHKFLISSTDFILVYRPTRNELLIMRVRRARENWRTAG